MMPAVRHTHAVALTLVALGLVISVEPGSAHKPITSPYTYNDDVFPILRDRCGTLPRERRRRADVADDARGHGAVGRIDPDGAPCRSHAARRRGRSAGAIPQSRPACRRAR